MTIKRKTRQSAIESSLLVAMIAGVSLTGCIESDSSGDSEETSDQPTQEVGDTDEESSGDLDDERVEILVNEDDRIIYERVDVVDSTDGRSIHERDPLQVFPGEDDGFVFEWEVDTGGFVNGEEMLYLDFGNDSGAIALSIAANLGQSTLRSEADCTYDNNSELTCFREGDLESGSFETTLNLSEHINELPATATLESELCSVLQGCKRVRIGRVQFN